MFTPRRPSKDGYAKLTTSKLANMSYAGECCTRVLIAHKVTQLCLTSKGVSKANDNFKMLQQKKAKLRNETEKTFAFVESVEHFITQYTERDAHQSDAGDWSSQLEGAAKSVYTAWKAVEAEKRDRSDPSPVDTGSEPISETVFLYLEHIVDAPKSLLDLRNRPMQDLIEHIPENPITQAGPANLYDPNRKSQDLIASLTLPHRCLAFVLMDFTMRSWHLWIIERSRTAPALSRWKLQLDAITLQINRNTNIGLISLINSYFSTLKNQKWSTHGNGKEYPAFVSASSYNF
jgi:hypothetical protein